MSNIESYFKNPWKEDGRTLKSPYMAVLRDARKATNRNQTTGNLLTSKKTLNRHGSWIGSLGYLILIDHVGSHFTLIDADISRGSVNNFIYALKVFSDLSEKERLALYALRNCFAHDYGLTNIPDDRMNTQVRDLLFHHFVVYDSDNGEMISFPKTRWDGSDITKKSHITKINLRKVGNFVEEMHISLKGLAAAKKLKVTADLELIHY